jgi:hypothetical protein
MVTTVILSVKGESITNPPYKIQIQRKREVKIEFKKFVNMKDFNTPDNTYVSYDQGEYLIVVPKFLTNCTRDDLTLV